MSHANQKAQRVVDRLLASRLRLDVLEAGCGSTSHLRLPPGATLTGIDISEQQLARNDRLQERICGDLQTYQWASSRFDLIVCWDVLEHLSRPRDALEHLFRAVAPGGVLLFALPNLYSLKGLVTKFTPYAFHVWFYRHVMGDKSPHEEFGQFPTYLRRDIGPARLRATFERHGLSVAHFDLYEGPVQADLRARSRVADACFGLAGGVCKAITFGRWDLNQTDMILVLQKPSRPSSSTELAGAASSNVSGVAVSS